MKKLLLSVLLFAFTCQVFGQAGKNIPITTSESGTDFRTNTPLIAREYQFALPVFNFYPAPEQHEITVLLRKKNATNDL
ncbi:hypothetical protein [Dyadobacter sp. Leaf189]|uniref:hypothetical protein n=1 Tax=Dyadobacter sp. Leaf189 TaxID=1736295 RepID=UPI0006FDC4DA|nr:hypothetical protein [Dyadobacter sp. Leaf189]KQS30999.1 hypothetical protein ASG33_11590 [Dyadobacter sp. Leaf189]